MNQSPLLTQTTVSCYVQDITAHVVPPTHLTKYSIYDIIMMVYDAKNRSLP